VAGFLFVWGHTYAALKKEQTCHIFEKIIGYIGNIMRGREADYFPDSIE
jgi:hypothetical protein